MEEATVDTVWSWPLDPVHFNERGRAFYDRYTSGPSDFIIYQWK